MSHEADVVVVGSGPSGVSAALPLLEAGMRVLLLDGGKRRPAEPLPGGAYHDIRRTRSDQWRAFLGPELEVLSRTGPPSPKFDAPGSRFAYEDLARTERIEGRGFAAIGSLARGGFSNIWGAGIATYGAQDLEAFPLTLAELAPSYERVARRIGVAGFEDDDLAGELDGTIPTLPPMPVSENARRVMRRYARRRERIRALGLRLGSPRIAVLTRSHGVRRPCALCDMCVWGCSENAIYGATHDFPQLQSHAGLDYRPGAKVETIRSVPGGYRLSFADRPDLEARLVVLAAGGLVTTRLLLEMQERFDESVPVVGAPGVGFALCLPERIGAALSTKEFSMGQISFSAEAETPRPGDEAYGTLFPASGIPAWLMVERMPLSRPGAVRLFRRLQPALLVGNCFLPGHYSRNSARLVRGKDGRARMIVQGGGSKDLERRRRLLRRQIAGAFRRLGAWLVPRSFSPIGPGEEIRYGGMFPMRATPGPGEVDAVGELHGFAGLHIVDLSIFPALPAKHHTLTMMANADRIGRAIAERWRGAA